MIGRTQGDETLQRRIQPLKRTIRRDVQYLLEFLNKIKNQRHPKPTNVHVPEDQEGVLLEAERREGEREGEG